MGLGYTLFVKPILTLVLAVVALSGLYLLPEYWPDRYIAGEAIRQGDDRALMQLLARGLHPDERAQWRSFPRRLLGGARTWGVGSSPDIGPAEESLTSFAVGLCNTAAARHLVAAGADLHTRRPDGGTLLAQAAACGDAVLVTDMVARGASPNVREPDGGTALWEHSALGWRRRPLSSNVVEALERAGAAPP